MLAFDTAAERLIVTQLGSSGTQLLAVESARTHTHVFSAKQLTYGFAPIRVETTVGTDSTI